MHYNSLPVPFLPFLNLYQLKLSPILFCTVHTPLLGLFLQQRKDRAEIDCYIAYI